VATRLRAGEHAPHRGGEYQNIHFTSVLRRRDRVRGKPNNRGGDPLVPAEVYAQGQSTQILVVETEAFIRGASR
jgi:hypothetical protein